MSQSRALQIHITQLEDIRSILNAMKNLAVIEIHKLGRYQAMQSQAVTVIEHAAQDFLHHYPELNPDLLSNNTLAIVLGAERGFCGDFNECLLKTMSLEIYKGIIAIGSRLSHHLTDCPVPVITTLAGANVTEEVPIVLTNLIEIINQQPNPVKVNIIYHDVMMNKILTRQIIPPFVALSSQPTSTGHPPLLNLTPTDFLADLIHHYLFAVLNEIFYISLTAENHRRLQHLEAAVNHLDDNVVNLRRKSQVYRQEEITEEIEVILLHAE